MTKLRNTMHFLLRSTLFCQGTVCKVLHFFLANKVFPPVTSYIMQMVVLPSKKAVLSSKVVWLREPPVCVIPDRSISPHPSTLHKYSY